MMICFRRICFIFCPFNKINATIPSPLRRTIGSQPKGGNVATSDMRKVFPFFDITKTARPRAVCRCAIHVIMFVMLAPLLPYKFTISFE